MKWFEGNPLTCVNCGRWTWRPPHGSRRCAWCEGTLA